MTESEFIHQVAMAAMQKLIETTPGAEPERVAERAYKYAKAMLVEWKKI